MPNILDRTEFQPSKKSRELWLATRKGEINLIGLSLPSLFSTINYSRDRSFFIAAIIVEFMGVAGLVVAGASRGFSAGLIAGLGALAIVLLDYFGVITHHKPIEERNKDMALKAINPNSAISINKKWARANGHFIVGWILLLLSTILKIGGIVLFFGKLPAPVLMLLIILYVFVCYTHGFHSGYVRAYYKTQKSFEKDHDKWAKDFAQNSFEIKKVIDSVLPDYFAIKKPNVIELSQELFGLGKNSNPISVNGHRLNFVNHVDSKYTYNLISRGLLIDEDITDFCSQFQVDAKPLLALEIRRLQLESLNG